MTGLQPEPVVSMPTQADIMYIVLGLRETEREETFDTLLLDPADPVEHLAAAIEEGCQNSIFCELYSDPGSGRPFALAFMTRTTLTCATYNFLCTPDALYQMRWLAEQAHSRRIATMRRIGLLRVEARARDIASHVRWLEKTGATIECRIPGYSRHAFVQAAWTLKEGE